MAKSPFATSACLPGHGTVRLTLLPPATPTFSTLTYAYPLKLLPSTPHILADPSSSSQPSSQPPTQPSFVPLLFLLSYGGGLLPPDTLSLTIHLAPLTRLTLTTQGSTKIFPSPAATPTALATQTLTAHLAARSGLLIAPDPTQPFQGSGYVQKQVFEVDIGGAAGQHGEEAASLGVLDWMTEGRRSRGERWTLRDWRSGMEIWAAVAQSGQEAERRLLLRDNIILHDTSPGSVAARMDSLGVFGTLVLLGPLFAALGDFFVREFGLLPRIGGRDWGDGDGVSDTTHASAEMQMAEVEGRRLDGWRHSRWKIEREDGVLWTAARVRGCVVVKFGAREVEGGRKWLGSMWREEGSVGREFGEGGLMCVR